MTPDDAFRLEDVTARRLLEVFDTLGFGVALLDADLRFVDVSPRLSELLGRTAAELRALGDPAVIVVPEDRHMVAERRAALVEGDPDARLEAVELVRPDGARIPIEFSSMGISWPDGGTGLVAICRDLRDRRARDEVLSQYMSLAAQMPLGLLFWDAADVDDPMDLRLVAANAGAARLVGVDLDSFVGRTIAEVFPATDPTDAARLLALAGTDRLEHFADLVYPVGDTTAVFRWQAAGLPGPAVGVFFEDITHQRSVELDRRRLLERLIETGDEERRRLAAEMHDDPVQKLAAATMMVEALRRHPDLPGRGDRLDAVETTLRSTMATLRRLTFELSPPELAESGLEAAVRSAAAFVFEDAPVELSIRADLATEPSAAVQTAAFRIITEALTNARKHARATTVSVTMSDRDEVLVIEVTDDGVGFDESVQAPPGHMGVRTMQERASTLGGSCRVASRERGVTVTAEVPLDGWSSDTTEQDMLHETDPSLVAAEQWETLRHERDGLERAAAAAMRRADLAEGRLRNAFGITKAMLEPGLSTSELAAVAARHLGDAMRDAAVIHLVQTDGQHLERVAEFHLAGSSGLVESLLSDGPGQGHLGTVLRSGEALVLDRRALRAALERQVGAGPAPHSVIVAPLVHDGVVSGTVSVVRDLTEVPYDDDDLDFFRCLVDRVAIALRAASDAPPA
ncbi:MAG: PAS domain-containing protein [Microthrixaceae bacterium]